MTITLIRSTLWSLYYRRRKTVERLRQSGRNVKAQIEALQAIKIQLAASEHWTLNQHMAMVSGLKSQITLLLTVTFIREVKYRTRIVELINECQGIQNQPTLFT